MNESSSPERLSAVVPLFPIVSATQSQTLPSETLLYTTKPMLLTAVTSTLFRDDHDDFEAQPKNVGLIIQKPHQ